MKNDYFIIEGIMYIVAYENNDIRIYKLVDNKRIPLNEKEEEGIQKRISNKVSYLYTSNMLYTIIDNNEELKRNEMVPNLLEWLESIIPEDSRNNFYKNIDTLKIESGPTSYNVEKNTISIDKSSYSDEYELSKDYLHELIHMASSNGKDKSGYDNCESTNLNEQNRALTEGIVEYLTNKGINDTISNNSIECLVAGQLIEVVGLDVVLENFFKNGSLEHIESKLRDIKEQHYNDQAEGLLRGIEIAYTFKNADEQNVLGNVQLSLLDYFDKKCENVYKEPHGEEKIGTMINNYEKYLITSEKILIAGDSPSKYTGIDESIERFNGIKNKYTKLVEEINPEYPIEEYKYNPLSKAGYSTLVILSILTTALSIGLIILGTVLTFN